MSSQETKKSGAKFGKFGSKKPSATIKVPKLIKPSETENGPAVSVDARPAPKKKPGSANGTSAVEGDRTEELPDEELLDESDLEELDDSALIDDDRGSVDVPADVTSGIVEVKPVDPYGATQAIGADDVNQLRAHKAAADAARAAQMSGALPGISADPLAAPPRPNTAEDEAAAVAALDGLDEVYTVEDSLVGMQAQGNPMMSPPPGSMMSPPPGAMMSPPPGAMMSPVPGAMANGAASSGPFPAVHTPYPGYSTPTPFPQQAPQIPMAQSAPPPGSMEAARNASWKQAHPSARRWARRRDNQTGAAGRPTPAPLRLGAGLILIGIGIYLLAIFIPAHRPDAPAESERTEAGKIWRFSETQHSLAAALAFGFIGLGLFGAVRGAVYRREVMTHCRSCQMKVEATREGLSLRCHNGGHKAGLAVSSVAMLAAFLIIGLATLALLASASLG